MHARRRDIAALDVAVDSAPAAATAVVCAACSLLEGGSMHQAAESMQKLIAEL